MDPQQALRSIYGADCLRLLIQILLFNLFRNCPHLVPGHLLHVRQIIWDDFIRFNWESRQQLRGAVSGKTGPNHWMDDGRLISLTLSLGRRIRQSFKLRPKTMTMIYGIKFQYNIISFQFFSLFSEAADRIANIHINLMYLITFDVPSK